MKNLILFVAMILSSGINFGQSTDDEFRKNLMQKVSSEKAAFILEHDSEQLYDRFLEQNCCDPLLAEICVLKVDSNRLIENYQSMSLAKFVPSLLASKAHYRKIDSLIAVQNEQPFQNRIAAGTFILPYYTLKVDRLSSYAYADKPHLKINVDKHGLKISTGGSLDKTEYFSYDHLGLSIFDLIVLSDFSFEKQKSRLESASKHPLASDIQNYLLSFLKNNSELFIALIKPLPNKVNIEVKNEIKITHSVIKDWVAKRYGDVIILEHFKSIFGYGLCCDYGTEIKN